MVEDIIRLIIPQHLYIVQCFNKNQRFIYFLFRQRVTAGDRSFVFSSERSNLPLGVMRRYHLTYLEVHDKEYSIYDNIYIL